VKPIHSRYRTVIFHIELQNNVIRAMKSTIAVGRMKMLVLLAIPFCGCRASSPSQNLTTAYVDIR
jgi:hypothetical protein